MLVNQKISRVPGTVQAAKEKYIEDLTKYTKAQLEEMRERQLKLLSNKVRLSKLPDKGDRIQQLFNRIEQEINARNKIDEAAKLFSDLNIAEKGIKTVTHMEWNTKAISKSNQEEIITAAAVAENSDDDEEERDEIDPIKVLAQSRENVKMVKVVKPPKSLITAVDLEEIKSFGNESTKNAINYVSANKDSDSNSVETRSNSSLSESSSTNLEPHAMYVCDKVQPEKNNKIKTKFLPHKTTKSNVHSVEKEKQRLKGKHWEVTAATPPIIRNSEVKLITLQESIEVERKHKDELKSLMEQQAIDRLEQRRKIVADNINLLPPGSSMLHPNEFFETYRERNRYEDDSEADDLSNLGECFDEDDVLDRGGVSVVLYDH